MEIQPGQWIPVLLAFVAVALMVLTLALLWEWVRERSRHRELKRRMDPGRASSGGETIDDLFKRSDDRGGGLLGPFAERLPRIYDLQILLDQADLRWHFGTFVILTIGAAVAFGTAGMLFTNFPLIAIGTALLGGTLPYLFVRWKKRKRMAAFLERFPDAIDLLGRAIRAGHARRRASRWPGSSVVSSRSRSSGSRLMRHCSGCPIGSISSTSRSSLPRC